ncbi:MAG: hypothetical protein D4R68_01625 [Ignavibacteriales bacterium]|nr:MAG: hypothetical protein D4R68_01625 [Ignavibacteriales bacterium]
MKMITDYMGKNIVIAQTSVFKRNYEIRVNEELIGSMQQKGFFGMMWKVDIQNKKWEIYKPSFWRSALDIREAGYEMPIANYTRDGFRSRGTLSLPLGEKLKIVPHLFKGFCEINNEQEVCLAKIIPKKISMKDRAEVMIVKKDDLLDKYPWIIILAYIITIEQRHQAAHSAH